jgi:hypothetical protein
MRTKSRHIAPINTFVSGNVMVTRFEARSATIQKAGVERIILWSIRELRGGKIASSRCCLPERTDPQTLRFLEWDYAHPTQLRIAYAAFHGEGPFAATGPYPKLRSPRTAGLQEYCGLRCSKRILRNSVRPCAPIRRCA